MGPIGLVKKQEINIGWGNCRYQEDRSLLKQYAEGDQVIDNGKIYKVQSEVVPRLSDVYPLMTRPIIRLPERGIVLTRINPSVCLYLKLIDIFLHSFAKP